MSKALTATEVVDQVKRELESRGFDIVLPFPVHLYNSSTTHEPLPTFCGPNTLALLIGNSKALWPHFVSFLEKEIPSPDCLPLTHPSPRDLSKTPAPSVPSIPTTLFPHPLRFYTHLLVNPVVEELSASGIQTEVRYDWQLEKEKFVHMQHLAHLIGAVYWNRQYYLNIHPVYGPWLAWRAVITIGLKFEGSASVIEQSDPLSPEANLLVSEAFKIAKMTGDWRSMLKVREACPLGKEWRYSEQQIQYHYDQTNRWKIVNSILFDSSSPKENVLEDKPTNQ